MVIGDVEALWAAIDHDDDWSHLETKIAAIRRTGSFNRILGLLSGPHARPGHTPKPAGQGSS